MAAKVWMRCAIALVAVAVASGCGGSGKTADSADDAEGDGEGDGGEATNVADAGSDLAPGTSVCITTNGVRYVLEDALAERQLEVADNCLNASIELEEIGESGAWELKHRDVGGEWKSCKSKEEQRGAFLSECLGALGAQISLGET